MEIKCSKFVKIFNLTTAIILSLSPLCFFVYFGGNIEIYLLLCLIFQIFTVKTICLFFKTLYINDSGCTVKVWFSKRFYKWSELKTIRIEDDYEFRFGARGETYKKGVVFSTRENFKTPWFMTTLSYMQMCINPFSFFVVFFEPEDNKKRLGIYEVKESEFIEKMAEYGVELKT